MLLQQSYKQNVILAVNTETLQQLYGEIINSESNFFYTKVKRALHGTQLKHDNYKAFWLHHNILKKIRDNK